MATLLGEVIRGVRLTSPAYRQEVVPNRVLIEAFGAIQRQLAQQGTRRYSGLLVQRTPVYLDLDHNGLADFSAGGHGGLPAQGAILNVGGSTAGSAVAYDLTEAQTVVNDFVPTGVGALTVTLTGAGRVVNDDAGYYLWITDGPGSGDDAIRPVASNTADTWTLSTAFARLPVVGQSVIRLIVLPNPEIDGLAVSDLPARRSSVGYLVKLSATGQPYIDLTAPMVATLRSGMPLPPHDRLIGLDVLWPSPPTGTYPVYPGTTSTIPIRHQNTRVGALAWVQGEELHLGGTAATWSGITSLELVYVPIPPLFNGEDRDVFLTPFLLPDTAYPALVAQGCLTAAQFAQAKGQTVDVGGAKAMSDAATADWLLSLSQRATALERSNRSNR